MKEFTYTIKDALGIHARPAGLLVKCAKMCDSNITITRDDKEVDATRIMSIMGMAIKQGQVVTVRCTGEDEEKDLKTMQDFFEKNL